MVYIGCMGLQRDCLEYMGFVLAVFPLKCGFIIVQVQVSFQLFPKNTLQAVPPGTAVTYEELFNLPAISE